MSTDVVLVGAGGFGRETLDVIEAHNGAHPERALTVLGVVDDAPNPANLRRLGERGYRHLGSISDAISAALCSHYVLGIGSPTAKAEVDRRFSAAGWTPVSVVHPTAVVGSAPRQAEGVIICGGVQVSTNVVLGRHVQINPNATIGHDAILNDYVSINPGGIVSGEVTIGARTLVGAGAVILQQLTVGAGTIIGAGSVVTKDVPDDAVVKGVPGVWR